MNGLLRAGRALYRCEGESGCHVFFILCDPFDPGPCVVVVPMFTRKRHHQDETLVLNVGDHPFIEHETIVGYSDVRKWRVDQIVKWFRQDRCDLQADADPSLLDRLRAGLFESPWTVNHFRDLCNGLW